RRAHGLSLVELMVALVIGMLAIIVVMQVFALSEGSRRTITSGSDATNSGALALVTLHRQARQAGFGASAPDLLGCDLALPGGWTLAGLAPLTVNPAGIPAGDANTDTLLIVEGSHGGSPEGDLVMAQPGQNSYAM